MGRTTSTSALAVTSMRVQGGEEFLIFSSHDKSPCPFALRRGIQPNHSTGAQPTKMPLHTCACLLHCSNLGSHLYTHSTSSPASEHRGWTPRHLPSSITLSIHPASPPAASTAGLPLASDVDLGLADPMASLMHHCAQHSIQLSTLPTQQTLLPACYRVRSCHPISLRTPVGHTHGFGHLNLIQGHMLRALLQVALPPLCIEQVYKLVTFFFQPIDFQFLKQEILL